MIAMAQLVAEGVTHILGIPGEHNLPLCDSVLDYPQLQFLTARHEQGLVYMANGYARATHRIAVPLVISGPGVTNSLTGLADAYQDSVPMILIAARPPSWQIGRGAFHELKQQSQVLQSVAKNNYLAESAAQIPTIIHQAFITAFADRPGPVTVEIPLEVQQQTTTATTIVSHTVTAKSFSTLIGDNQNNQDNNTKILQLIQLLSQAQQPMLYIGRGAVISGCADYIKTLVERLDLPCFHTALAKGILPPEHPLNLSWGGAKYGLIKEYIAHSDMVLVIGSSLDDSDAQRFELQFPENLVQIDSYAANIGRAYPVKLGIVGDAKLILQQLITALPTNISKKSITKADFSAYRQTGIAAKSNTVVGQFIYSIQTAISNETLVFSDPSWVNGWVVYFLEHTKPNTFHCARNFCGLGFSFPAALGAKLAKPESQVLAIIGDGGFLFTNAELATAVQYQLNIVTIIFNDQGYGSIKRRQQKAYNRVVGVDLVTPNFTNLATAFGAIGIIAKTPAELHKALQTAWKHKLPVMIEVPMDNNNPELDI